MDVPSVMEPAGSFEESAAQKFLYFSLGTLSTSPTAVIASLAFIVADPKKDGPPDTHYFRALNWEQPGRSYNFSWIQGWLEKSALARKSVCGGDKQVQVTDALGALVKAYTQHGCDAIWGSAADLAILSSALEEYKIDRPWDRTEERDIVSVVNTLDDLGMVPEFKRGATEPEDVALGDAALIARMVATVYRGYRTTDVVEHTVGVTSDPS